MYLSYASVSVAATTPTWRSNLAVSNHRRDCASTCHAWMSSSAESWEIRTSAVKTSVEQAVAEALKEIRVEAAVAQQAGSAEPVAAGG